MRPLVEELEPRILHSADAAGALFDPRHWGGAAEVRLLEAQPNAPDQASAASAQERLRREPVRIDERAPDYQTLVDDLVANNDGARASEVVLLDPRVQNSAELRDLLLAQQKDGRELEVFVLDAARDGVEQIGEILARHHSLAAVHVLSHGTAQRLQLGSTWLDAQTINDYSNAIRGWQSAFASDADLLLYGCDLASGEAGRSLVDTLGRWTGTDVAASTDLTGYALFGGDWDLEYRTGRIETAVAADAGTQRDWFGLMSVAVDATSTGSASTANNVTVLHTTTAAGERLMLVGVSMDATGAPAVSSVTYGVQNLSLVGTQTGGANPVRVEIWSLVNPAAGPANVVVNLSKNADGVSVGVTTFTGVNQISPLGTFASAFGTSASPSVNVTSATGELVYDVVVGKDATSLTQDPSQIELWELANGGGDQRGASSTEAGAATVTMSWTKTTWATAEWAIGAVSIKPMTIQVTPTSGLLTTEAGGTATFNVVLPSAPSANVTIPVSSSNTSEGTVNTSSLTFTPANWNIAQAVTITGVDDALADGYQGYTIVLGAASSTDGTYSGVNLSDVQVANSDDDINFGLITVDTTSDTADGDTTSLAALAANRGADGFISLREAIGAANNTANGAGGADRIYFNIAGTGAHSISPTTALPAITGAVVIDATTDDSYAANSSHPAIILDGNNSFAGDGFVLTGSADGSTIRGLVIRDFTGNGITIDAGSDGNTIAGNYVGRLSPTGADAGASQANTGYGFLVLGANNTIGGTSASDKNVIAGNTLSGVYLTGASATGNLVSGNYLGTNEAGTSAIANGWDGVSIDGGAASNTIGGTAAGSRNLISGNTGRGIWMDTTSGNVIQGNYIGTDAAGSTAIANGQEGINANNSASNTIGGTSAAARNVISGNSSDGITIVGAGSTSNVIQGNYIGTTAAGNVALGNAAESITLDGAANTQIGGTVPGAGNVIAAGGQEGIWIINGASGTVVQGNWIGTDVTGTVNLGNAGGGVSIGNTGTPASGNLIGGTAAGAGNVIAFNTLAGVAIDRSASGSSVGNSVLGNSIYSNTGLGIDLDDTYSSTPSAGVTANDSGDADTGGNNRQNFPVLTSTTTTGAQVTVNGTLNSTASTQFRIEFFASTAQDATGYGEGQRYLGSLNVTTDGSGNATINATLAAAVAASEFICATATKSDATFTTFTDTSEFAESLVATSSTFQQGTGGYSGTEDTELSSTAPSSNFGANASIDVDHEVASDNQALILFNNIFGTGTGQIPAGSTIVSASLRLYASGGTANTISAHRMLVSWSEASTWNSLTGGVQTSGTEAEAAADGTYVGTGSTGYISITGLEQSVQAWSGGASNYGWVLLNSGTDGLQFDSSEAATVARRPQLIVEYIPPNDAPTYFVGDGKLTTDFAFGSDTVTRMAVQADGKIVVVGAAFNGTDTDIAVARYNTDGSLDATFGTGGKVTTSLFAVNESGNAVAIQADGKILVAGITVNAGNTDFALIRYNANGSLDTSFDTDGKLSTVVGTGYDEATSIAVQSDGKILVAGLATVGANYDFAVVRYNTNGSLDTSFDTDGRVTTPVGTANDFISAMAVQSDGKIVVAGFTTIGGSIDFALARYNTNGSLDASFDTDGKLTTAVLASTDMAHDVAIQSDGKILVAGSSNNGSNNDFALVRYNTSGALDTSFDTDGKLTTAIGTGNDDIRSIAVQSDGKILAAGSAHNGTDSDIALVRYNGTGSLDTGFDTDGKLTSAVGSSDDFGRSVVVQTDGRILVAGYSFAGVSSDFALIRYNTDGSLDTRFDLINTLDGAPTYTENGAPIVLASNVQVFDAELSALNNFSGATLTLARNGGASAQDVFSATGNLATLAQGGNLVLSGVTIGTVTTNSGGTLLLTFNGSATQARVNETLRSIAYANSSDAPPASAQIDRTFNDGNTGAQGTGGAYLVTGGTTVTITPVNDAPTLSSSYFLGQINEDTVDDFGIMVSTMVSASDPDAGALTGIAITAADTTNGIWQFTLDGTTWRSMGTPSLTAAVLLPSDATTRFRFIPNGDWNGSALLSYKAWDQTSGAGGGTADVSVSGGTTAFSTNTSGTSKSVLAINDAPAFLAGTGTLTTSLGAGTTSQINAVAVQPDGKILAVGQVDTASGRDTALIRYNRDGSLDSSFGGGTGMVISAVDPSTDFANSVALLGDGKILVAGTAYGAFNDIVVVRYTASGTLDTSFGGGDGIANTGIAGYDEGYAMAVQAGGTILVAGVYGNDFLVTRFTSNGILDNTFGTSGRVTTDFGGAADQANGIVIQPDGKFLVVGRASNIAHTDVGLARYNADGSLDASFGTAGKVLTDVGTASNDSGTAVRLQADGKILVAGWGNAAGTSDFYLLRYNTDGSLDTTFNATGKVVTAIATGGMQSDFALCLAVQTDGKIVVGGYDSNNTYNFTVVRYTATGGLDASFGNAGIVDLNFGGSSDDRANTIAVQPDGKIVIAGTSTITGSYTAAIARLNAYGSLDSRFNLSQTLGSTVSYTENGTPVVLDANVVVFDADLSPTNFNGATLTLARNGGANTQDQLAFDGINVTTSGADVLVGVVQIGTYSFTGGQMVVTLGVNATQARVNTLMQNIVYWNASNAPPGSVQIDWAINDGNIGAQGSGGVLQATGSTTVTINPVNEAPSGADKTITTAQNTPHIFTLADFGFSDSDGNNFEYVWVNRPSAGELRYGGAAVIAATPIERGDIITDLLTFHPASGASGSGYATFTFQVQDDGGTMNGGVDLDPTPNTITVNVPGIAVSTRDGGETRVNTTTADTQYAWAAKSLATDASGNAVVVWASGGAAPFSIYAQRLDASGAKVGPEIHVNTNTTPEQYEPAVAMAANGDFVVVWTSDIQDGDEYGIYARRFNAAGVAQGSEFRVNTTTTQTQYLPVVAMDDAGNFVIAWTSYDATGTDPDIFVQRYSAAGVAQGGETRVNTETSDYQIGSAIAMNGSGQFVVVWNGYNNQDGDGTGIFGQHFDAAGNTIGTEFQVNTYTTGDQYSPSVAMDDSGAFVVTWDSNGQDGSAQGVYLQRFDPAGDKVGTEIRANTYTAGGQYGSSVSLDASGGFVVAWTSVSQDNGTMGVFGQRFSAAGAALATEFRISTTSAGNQREPSVAFGQQGRLLVAWAGNGPGDASGVFLQRYLPAFTTEAGTTATFLVALDTQPTADVTIAIATSDATEATVSVPSLTFTAANWNTPQTVTVTGLQDFINDGDIIFSVLTGTASSTDPNYNGLDPVDVVLTNLAVANLAPVNTVPSGQTMSEDGTLVFSVANGNLVAVSDVDAGTNSLQVTLTAANGALTLSGTTGLIFTAGDGNADATMTFTGTIDSINTALNSLRFDPAANYNGSVVLTLNTNDQGNTGTGPAQSDNDTVAITVNAVNDAPTLGNGTLAAISEDAASPAGQSVSTIFSGQFADVDASSSFGGIAVVGNAADAGTQGVWEYSTNSGTNWFAIGTVADGATALALSSATLVRFVPVSDYNGTPTALTVRGLDDTYVTGFSTTAGSETRVAIDTTTNGGVTPIATAPASASTSITAVNDAPVRTAGTVANLTVLEDSGFTSLGFAGVTYGPGGGADETGQTLSYAVTALPSGTAGNVFLADGTTQVTLSSYTLTEIRGMQFKTTANGNGVTAFQYNVTDSGGGGSDAISEFILITVTAVNDAPTLTATALNPTVTEAAGLGTQAAAVNLFGSAAASTVESGQRITGLTFTVSGLADGANEVIAVDGRTIALGVTSSGTTVTNGLTYNSTVSGATATVVLSGGSLTAAATQTLVNGISYQDTSTDNPSAGSRVFTLTQIKDNGGTANSGADTTTLSIGSTLAVAAVNDVPVATIIPATYATTEQVALTLKNTGLSISDVDAASGSMTVTLSVTEGALTVTAGGSGAVVSNSGTSSVTITGTVTQINNLLNTDGTSTLSYIDNIDAPSASATLSLLVDDNGNTGGGSLTNSDTATINITAVNDAPVNTVPASQATPFNTALVFSGANTISIADVDAGANPLQVTLTAAHGTLTLGGTVGLSFSSGTGTGNATMTFQGTLANINAALAGTTFTPTTSYSGAATVQITTDDLAGQVVGNTTVFGSNTVAGAFDKNQIGTQVSVPTGGTLTSISAHLINDKANTVRYGIYTDVAGEPGTLLAQATTSLPKDLTGSWYTLQLPSTALSAGNYWIGLDVEKEGVYFYSTTGGNTRLSNYDPALGLASPWSGTYASNTQSLSAYLSFTATGDTALTDTDTVNITVGTNAAPVLAAIEGTSLACTENDAAAAITGTITLSDLDNASMASATVQITGNYQNDQDVLSFTNTAGITGSWNAGSGTLTLSGVDSVANYQAALRAVKYANTSDNPSTLARTVSFTGNDGTVNGNTVTRNITVTAVNDAPVLGNGTLAADNEDTASAAGQSVSTIFSGQFADVDAGSSFGGIAVVGNTANAGTQGVWQYSTNSGTNWFAIGTVADGATARALSSASLIRFVPVGNYSGAPPALTARGLDNSYVAGFSSSAGSDTRVNVDTTTTGGTTAIAAATASLSTSITAVNDAPVQAFTGANFNGSYAYNDFSGNWFVQNTSVNTGTIQSEPQGAVLHVGSSAGGSSSAAVIVYFDGSLALGGLQGGSVANTGSTLSMNLYLDTGNDGRFFSFAGNQFTGLNGDSYANVALGAGGGSFNDNTVFTKVGGIAALPSTFTLAQIKAGSVAGIDTSTRVSFWIGGGNSFSSDITSISMAASTAGSLTVLEDSGLTSLGLGGLALGAGGGADEAGQSLSYTVTAVPSAALGDVVLANGSTVVTASTSYSLAQIQGMQFRTASNANGSATFAFSVQDDGGTAGGGVDAITKSLAINVTAVNDPPVITSNGSGANASISIAENTTTVTTVTSTDVDGGTAGYSILAGGDGARFTIDSVTGVLSFLAAPDYENPTDLGGNNVYDLTVQVSDGSGGTGTQAIAVTVTDVASTLIVTTVSDVSDGTVTSLEALNANKGADGQISLREAILAANNSAGLDTITFNIAGAGVHSIALSSNLPSITDAISIDGYSQSGSSVNSASDGSNAVLQIELDGTGTGAFGTGLLLDSGSDGSTIRGLAINRFSSYGILLNNSDANTIAGNFIGANAAGTSALANAFGVGLSNGSNNNTIGGLTLAARNIISGNTSIGVYVESADNTVTGNLIGLNAAGTAAVANTYGVYVINVANTVIGGTTAAGRNVISGNTSDGIQVAGASATGTLIQGNYIGTNASGTSGIGNGSAGVNIQSSATGNTIGGAAAGAGNVISGNLTFGVFVVAPNNTVSGNIIGLDAAGTAKLANGSFGVYVTNAGAGTTVGGTTALARNVISGNGVDGIVVDGGGSSTALNVLIEGNYIGTGLDGASALGNSRYGIYLYNGAAGNTVGGTASGAGNVVSGSGTYGVMIAGINNAVAGNIIGLSAAGTGAVANNVGVYIDDVGGNTIGGTTALERNLISGNTTDGIRIVGASATGNLVQGNYIGTDSSGTLDRGNGGSGVFLNATTNVTIGGSAAGARNVISGNAGHGILIAGGSGHFVQGNYIGTDATGSVDLGNDLHGIVVSNAGNNLIGGTGAAERNVISGNNAYGIAIAGAASTGNTVSGNLVGLNAAGTAAIGNIFGVDIEAGASSNTIGGLTPAARNVISGNTNSGVLIQFGGTSGNQVIGNYIGTDAAGSAPVANLLSGVNVKNGATGNTVGGTSAGAGNLISGNAGPGVAVETVGTTDNAVLGNSIHGNTGLGIDLNSDSVTANDTGDADPGVNNLQNFPVLSSARVISGNQTTVTGTFNSTANSHFRIEFFGSATADATGYGEGQKYLGFVNVATDGSGNATFSTTLTASVAAGSSISATATKSNATFTTFTDTSEFAGNIVALSDGIRVTPVSVVALGGETRVNTATTDTQQISANTPQAMAADANGNFVVVWSSNLQDGDLFGVYAQRYSADGTAQGGEFQVNTTAADNQINPAVAMDAAGSFVVTWSSNNQDGSGYGVYARRYNAAGVAQGGEFLANTTTAGSQITSAIAMSQGGSFAIAWGSAQDPDVSSGIYAQRFDASGVAQGSEFRVNTYTTNTQQLASMAMDAAGNFVVTWASNLQDDGASYGVYGQRFDATGAAQGAEFRVNTTIANSQLYNDVAMLPDGRFVVVYQSRNADNTHEVYLQRYAADGSTIGGETRVNTASISSAQQPIPSITADASGNITVVWNNAADGSGVGVVGRRFDWSGTPLGGEFQVNSTSTLNQLYPEVVTQPGGRFIVAWGGNGPGDADGVFLQRYGLTTTEAGGTATFSVVLEAAPTANVVIPISVPDGTEGTVAVGSLTFTTGDWNIAQTVIVTGVQDYTNDGDVAYTVVLGSATSADLNFNDLNPADLSVTNLEVPNVAPANTVPVAQTVNEDTALVFSSGNGNTIAISDADAGSNALQITLSVTNGVLTLGGVSGLSFSSGANGSAAMTFTGTIAAINTALNGLRFDPAANYNGSAVLTLNTNDQGNTGTGGAQGDNDTVAITVNPIADTPSVTNATTNEDTQSTSGLVISRNAADGAEATHFQITGISNGSLFQNDGTTAIANNSFITFAQGNAGLKFTPAANFSGSGSFAVQASTSNGVGGLGGSTVNATITVNPIADTPSITNATTNEDTQSTSGLVISRNAADGAEATHFQITGITNGTLFQNDGTTAIANNSFITFAQGNAGLKFTPAANFNGSGTFNVQASTSNLVGGLGGAVTSAIITVNPIADTPSITNATTNEDTQSTSGLVISRNAADGAEVTHFQITGISNGSLFQNDGTTAIADGDFITFAQGNAGLKFTPAANFSGNGTFTVQASTTSGVGGLGGSTVNATITVNAVNDAPTLSTMAVPVTTVNEDNQATIAFGNLQTQGNAADVDGTVTAFVVKAVSSGTLLIGTSAGTATAWAAGTNDTLDASHQGYWTGALDANGTLNSFTVVAKDDGGLESVTPVQVQVAVTAVNDAPVVTGASLTVNEGQTVTLAPANFGITDPDSASLTYTVSAVTGGIFQLSSAAGVSITTFTSAELAGGLVQFVDDGNEVAPSFSVKVNDGTVDSNVLAATINYTPVNDAPVVTGTSLTLNEGQTVTLAPANIVITDSDDASFTCTLSALSGGYFQLISAAGVPITTFSTAELAGGLVQFVDDGIGAPPAFMVSVTDGQLPSAPVSAVIRLNRVAPPLGTGDDNPPPPGPPTPGPEGKGKAPEEPTLPPGSKTAPVGSAVQLLGGTSRPADLPVEAALLAQSAPAFDATPVGQNRERSVSVTFVRIGSKDNVEPVTLSFPEDLRLEISQSAMAASGQGRAAGGFSAAPIVLGEDQGPQAFEIVADAAKLAGLAFSAGAVWWVMRIGGLVTSMFAALPAWRQFDPVQILPDKGEPGRPDKWMEEEMEPEAEPAPGTAPATARSKAR